MGFFKDFKEDISQAVNELAPGAEETQEVVKEEAVVQGTLGEDVDVKSELSKLDGLLEQVKEAPVRVNNEVNKAVATATVKEERRNMNETVTPVIPVVPETPVAPIVNDMNREIADETSVITSGTTLTGDMSSNGSLDIQGTINGNVSCYGKLVVTGTINGNSEASEFFADAAKIEGEVVSGGTVKVGAGSVIIGNITATSAVIAGAVKGDIDVQGPVVVDTSAVIMGNIKSRSVQINNGAVIEGFCSQCYSDVDVQALFAK